MPFCVSIRPRGYPARRGNAGVNPSSIEQRCAAIPHLKKALALDDDGSMHYSLARAYQAAGDTQLANETMQQYQKIQKQNQEINDKLPDDPIFVLRAQVVSRYTSSLVPRKFAVLFTLVSKGACCFIAKV